MEKNEDRTRKKLAHCTELGKFVKIFFQEQENLVTKLNFLTE